MELVNREASALLGGVIQNREGGMQLIYRKPASLRTAYSLEHCRLADKLDQLMDEVARQAAQ